MTKNTHTTIENDSMVSSFVPTDFTDVGQGTLLAQAYPHRLCYCERIGWLVYKDGIWVHSESDAYGYSQKLTNLQLQEAEENLRSKYTQANSSASLDDTFRKYVLSRRSSARISATMKEAIPGLKIEVDILDGDPLILNTPVGEVHLDTGEITPHDPMHYITHMTTQSPSEEGSALWSTFIDQISCGNNDIKDFLQQFAGMAAIGKVYEERLIIALGSGGNGKSTFFNAIQDVLGDYAGTIRSELMIASNDSGKKFEYANLRGKRFIIAEELEEGKQLDTASLKHLCSTGDINAQFKGKDVFTFKPSHSTVLCTNHMPAVKAVDSGTWDRIIVVPFKGRFRDQKSEIKNYGAYLAEHCGGAILQWIIEGAQQYIRNDYKLIIPEAIKDSVQNYRKENDWTIDFFEECLSFDPNASSTGSELYRTYKLYCQGHSMPALPQNVVLPTIEAQPNVTKKRTRSGMCYEGVEPSKSEGLFILDYGAMKTKCNAW